MKPIIVILMIISTMAFAPRLSAQGSEVQSSKSGIAEGLWEGSLTLRQSTGVGAAGGSLGQGSLSSGIRLKILAKGMGALLDIPDQSMFGYS
ncbi:MAG: hypothetical protein WA234_05055, partial [Rectinemataceae bacterium]